MQCDEIIVSLPNHFYPSDSSSPILQIKFYPKLFELMRKKYIRPETIPNSISIEALNQDGWRIKCQSWWMQTHENAEHYTPVQHIFLHISVSGKWLVLISFRSELVLFYIRHEHGNGWSPGYCVLSRRIYQIGQFIFWYIDYRTPTWFKNYWSMLEMVMTLYHISHPYFHIKRLLTLLQMPNTGSQLNILVPTISRQIFSHSFLRLSPINGVRW